MKYSIKEKILACLLVIVVIQPMSYSSGPDIPEGCDVVENDLVCIGASLTHIPDVHSDLEGIYLPQNNITGIKSGSLKNYINIKEIDLSSNIISEISVNSFELLTELLSLYLSSNKIKYIDPLTFQSNTKLERLFLNDNPILLPTNDFALQSSSLIELNIAYCNVSLIAPINFLRLQHLRKLDLRGNPLNYISRDTLDSIVNLNELLISDASGKCFGHDWQNVSDYMNQKYGIININICELEDKISHEEKTKIISESPIIEYESNDWNLITFSLFLLVIVVSIATSIISFLFIWKWKKRNESSKYFYSQNIKGFHNRDCEDIYSEKYSRGYNRLSTATYSTTASTGDGYESIRSFPTYVSNYEPPLPPRHAEVS